MKKDMKEIFENQPLSSEAPQGLRNKVEYAARQTVRKPWIGLSTRWIAVGAAAAAVGFFAFTTLLPAKAEAKTWDKVASAYENVKGMLIRLNFAGGDDQGDILLAYKGKEWRVSIQGGGEGNMDVSYSNGELTLWDGGKTAQLINIGMELPFSPEDIVKQISDEVSVSKLLEKGADEIGRENIVVEQPVLVDGRRVYNVFIDGVHGDGRVHIVVDAETDLPISISAQSQRGEIFEMSFEFNSDFDDSLLRPVLPTGVTFQHLDIGDMSKMGEKFGHDFDFGHKFGSDDGENEDSEDESEEDDSSETVDDDASIKKIVEIKGASVIR